MKKEFFLDSVCARLFDLGLSIEVIEKQRAQIDKYLSGMGIKEDAPELDGEDPRAFADGIFSLLKKNRTKKAAEPKNIPESIPEPVPEPEPEPEPEEDEEEDIKIFVPTENTKDSADISDAEEMPPLPEELAEEPVQEAPEPEIDEITEAPEPEDSASNAPAFDELEESLEEETDGYYDEEEPPEGATREYSISELTSEEEHSQEIIEEEDYYESDDGRKYGNPVFFWILTVLLSPVWIPIAALIFLLIGICYPLLILFVALYIPMLIVLIIGGSAATLAELVYSIVQFATGNIHIGIFELGLGIFLLALVMSLSVLIYRSGTKFAPRAIKKYGKTVKKLLRKLKRAIIKLKGVCSI